ncbi:DUF7010 family protein [Inhella gelatinilytica]|uniref:Uncharacterized protein n=1 Tax=Inhella gelatinilytica TaxID=2795030 RepID=A0A931IXR7_9BURK|nr:hypothetical protein [Inhella gelatinilytica]MBH9551791.1 hypothetical protein [Inhella gelatinilytica]
MNLTLTHTHQADMRAAHGDGAAGVLVSGLVWLLAALVCFQWGVSQGVWTLLIGGAQIYPLSLVVLKLLGRSGKAGVDNGLNALALASTVWLILGCAMAYGLYRLKPELFFPAMMATIACRYLVFASLYGLRVYWALGAALWGAAALAFFVGLAPAWAAALGGAVEVAFGLVLGEAVVRPGRAEPRAHGGVDEARTAARV